ncbi:MAG: hypothetical protein ACE5ED_08115 [Rhodothalassiaceae bacterium]
MRITDEMVVAYVDGELDAETRQCVRAAAAADREVAARIERYRQVRARLADAFRPIAETPAPPRLRALVEAGTAKDGSEVAGAAIDIATARRRRQERRPARLSDWRRVARWGMALAASLLLGILIGQVAIVGDEGAGGTGGGILIADSALARHLDEDLSGGEGATRILLSFRARDGRICRVFERGDGERQQGIACHAGKAWALVALATAAPPPSAAGGPYRPAGAAALPPPIERKLGELMAGDPLGRADEERLRARGWK